MSKCSKDGCNNVVKCRGLCNKHYHAYRLLQKMKPCGCGCGEQTAYTFKHGHHTRLFSSEEQSRRGRMNTGEALRGTGTGKSYIKRKQRHEHRTVMEIKLGRKLKPGEVVHHINGDHRDNRPENLEVMTRAEHIEAHREDLIRGRKNA